MRDGSSGNNWSALLNVVAASVGQLGGHALPWFFELGKPIVCPIINNRVDAEPIIPFQSG